MRRRTRVWLLCIAGCGRVGFEGREARDARDDGAVMGVDANLLTGCPADALLCETFDSGTAQWVPDLGAGGVIETAPTGLAGSGACLVSTMSLEKAEMYRDFAPTSGTLHIRVFMNFPSGGPLTGELDFFHVLDEPRTQALHLSSNGPGSDLAFEIEGLPPLFSTATTGLDRWGCFEISLTPGVAGSASLRLDGADIGATGTGAVNPTWNRLRLGVDAYPGSTPPPARACYDEVIIATSPIGCVRTAGL